MKYTAKGMLIAYKNLNRHFTKGDLQMVNKYMKNLHH